MPIQFTQEIIETSTKPIIIEAFATWCPHCAKMKPIYEELEKELGDKYIFSEFDVDKFADLSSQFKVQFLPTFIFMQNKKEVDRALGEMTKEELKKLIEKI
jgi:thioredoxin 1